MAGPGGKKGMAGKPRYSGGIGTAVTSKPGGPMVTLGGGKPKPQGKAMSKPQGKAVARLAPNPPKPSPAKSGGQQSPGQRRRPS